MEAKVPLQDFDVKIVCGVKIEEVRYEDIT